MQARPLKKRLAVIGVGRWGSKIVRTVTGSPRLELAAVVTSKTERAIRDIAPFSGVVLGDHRDLAGLAGGLDGVVIATPPAGRERIVDALLDQGLPVFSEKPLTLDAGQTRRLAEKSRRRQVPLVEDFIHLYAWPYVAILRQAAPGSTLDIKSVGGGHGPFRDYSPVYDYGPHDLSMTLQVFGCMPRALEARVVDRESEKRYSIRLKLDFGRRGRADLHFGNTFAEKRRIFRVRSGEDEWIYDDLAASRLLRNGQPVAAPEDLLRLSPLEAALDCFAGNRALYSQEDCLWLSEAVAGLTAEIEGILARDSG